MRIEFQEQLPFVDAIRILNIDGGDKSGDARADGSGAAIDEGIVSVLVDLDVYPYQCGAN